MTYKALSEALDNIDDSLISEAAVYRRRRSVPIFIAAAAAVFLIVSYFVSGTTGTEETIIAADEADGGYDGVSGAAGCGDEGGEFSTAEIQTTGEPFTEKEISEFFDTHKEIILYSLIPEYTSLNEIMISKKGFCPVFAQTEANTMRLDFETFPVIADGKIIAFADMARYNGEITFSLSYGGESWDRINASIEANPGEALAMVGHGYGMCAISPDNEVYEFYDTQTDYTPGFDLYSVYATEYSTYNLSEILESNDFITVGKEEYQ